MSRFVLSVIVLVSILTACAPAQASTSSLPTIQPPTCVGPETVIDAQGNVFIMQWSPLKQGDHGDYVSTDSVHYLLTTDGQIVLWKGSNTKTAPEFDVMDIGTGRLFIIPLTQSGPLFFFICSNGGAYIDDTRGIKIAIGQEG